MARRSIAMHGVSLAVIILFLSASARPAAGDISITAIGGAIEANAINSSGQVVGYGATTAFLYSGGGLQYLPTLPGGSVSDATAINSTGQVVGWSRIDAGNSSSHAFLYSGGVMTDLGTLLAGNSTANGINDSGQVVGLAYATGHAFLYSGGVVTDLGTLGGSVSAANGINNSGQVAGWSNPPGDATQHAFLYSGGVMTDLGTFGGSRSDALAINNSGQVVGLSQTASGGLDAFLYSEGVMTDLGALGFYNSVAAAINDNGQVVGYLQGNTTNAFLYSGGVMTNLNSLLPAGSDWALYYAFGINDAGQIVGVGTQDGGKSEEAFLMDLNAPAPPVVAATPEPSFYGILAVSLAGVLFIARSRKAIR